MGRKSSFTDREVFAAVGGEIAATGQFTLQRLRDLTALSTGSIYHRFQSREGLLAETWLNALTGFQARFVGALHGPADDPGLEAALATPRFCRDCPDEAVVLACCRQAHFLSDGTPAATVAEIAQVNAVTAEALRDFATGTGQPLLACKLAIVAYPLAAVRLFLPAQPVPATLDREIVKAYRAALAP